MLPKRKNKRRQGEEQQRAANAEQPRKNKYQLSKERTALEKRIHALEQRKEELETLLSSGESDYKLLGDAVMNLRNCSQPLTILPNG